MILRPGSITIYLYKLNRIFKRFWVVRCKFLKDIHQKISQRHDSEMVVYRTDIFVLDHVGVHSSIMLAHKEIERYFFSKLKKVIFILKISNKDDLEHAV